MHSTFTVKDCGHLFHIRLGSFSKVYFVLTENKQVISIVRFISGLLVTH